MTKKMKALADELFPDVEEQELEEGLLDIPVAQRRLITSTLDFSVSTLNGYLVDGTLRVPEYQRRFIWTGAKPSRLIESLIIQCPIPVIYLNRSHDEKLEVIDGNQRLTTVRKFLADDFDLRGLTAFPELIGSKYSDLEQRIQRHIVNRTLRCIIIEKETHPQIKFDVFERLNSGSMPLSGQELRNGLYHGQLMRLLENLSNTKGFKEMTGLKEDRRMKAEELALRFLALRKGWKDYKKPLAAFLNGFAGEHRNPTDAMSATFSSTFTTTLRLARDTLGTSAFRLETVTRSGTKVRKFNAAYYDAVMVGLYEWSGGKYDKAITSPVRAKCRHAVEALIADEAFRKNILQATSDETAVKERIKAVREALQQAA